MSETGVSSSAPSLARTTARSVSAIGVNHVAQVVGGVLFVLLVPRALGPEVYGQLAYAFAFTVIFQMLGELGYQEIFSRFVPEADERGGAAAVKRLARELFAVKGVAGVVLGVLATVAASRATAWMTDPDAVLIGVSVTVRIWAMAVFPLLLGLGQAGRWSVESTWRQLAVTLLLLWVFRAKTLTAGLAALAAHEVLFLWLGWWWARGHLATRGGDGERKDSLDAHASPASVRRSELPEHTHDLVAMLKLGAVFAVANFTLAAMFRVSPLAVEWLTGSSAEVGYFDLALGGLLLVYTLLGQLAFAFVRPLVELQMAGRQLEAELWLGRFVRYGTLLVVMAAGGMWAVAAPLAPVLFGRGFEPAAATILAIAWGLLPLPVAWGAVVLSTLEKQPLVKVRAALLGLAAFAGASAVFREASSVGVALAFSFALLGYTSGFGARALRAVRAGGPGWLIGLGAGLAFGLVGVFPPAGYGLIRWAIAAAIYSAIVVGLRVIPMREMAAVVRIVRS